MTMQLSADSCITSTPHLTWHSRLPPSNTKTSIVASLHFPRITENDLILLLGDVPAGGMSVLCHAAWDDIITRPYAARQKPSGAERAVILITSTS